MTLSIMDISINNVLYEMVFRVFYVVSSLNALNGCLAELMDTEEELRTPAESIG